MTNPARSQSNKAVATGYYCAAAATQGLLRAQQSACRAATVAAARIAAFSYSTLFAPSQRRSPPNASNACVLPSPSNYWKKFHMPLIFALQPTLAVSESLGTCERFRTNVPSGS
jgi:hypothetical protein